MNKLSRSVAGFKGFINEVKVELTKCAWPTRPELIGSTIVVIISVILLSAFIGVSDLILTLSLKAIVG